MRACTTPRLPRSRRCAASPPDPAGALPPGSGGFRLLRRSAVAARRRRAAPDAAPAPPGTVASWRSGPGPGDALTRPAGLAHRRAPAEGAAMTIFRVRHLTTYSYRRPVRFGGHQVMFRPRDSYDQRLHEAELRVDPQPAAVRWIHDVFGNCVAHVAVAAAAAELRFETRIRLEHTPQARPDLEIDRAALTYPFDYGPDEAADLAATIRPHYPDPDVEKWARRFVPAGRRPTDRAPADDALLRDPRGLRLFAPRRAGHPAAAAHAAARPRHLPRLRAPDDGGGAHARPRRTLRHRLRLRPRPRRRARCSAAARPMPGARSTCPAPAGSSSIPTNGIVGNRDLIRVAVARDPRQAVPLSGSYRGARDRLRRHVGPGQRHDGDGGGRHAAGVTGAGTSPARRRCPAIASLRSQEGPPEKCAYVPDTS